MKKFLSLFLVLTMVLSMLTLPTFAETVGDAAGTPTPTTSVLVKDIADGVTTVNHEGVTYTVVRDLAGFKKIGAGGNYILADDLDFGSTALGASTVAVTNSFTLQGNGHTITMKVDINGGGQGVFGTIPNADVDVYIKNVTFNVSGQLRNNSTGVLFGTAKNNAGSSVNFEKVIMNCNDLKYNNDYAPGQYVVKDTGADNYWQGCCGAGLFYAKIRSAASFTDCLLTGSFTSTSNSNEYGVGGFVGLIDCNQNVTVSFTRCKAANGSFTTTNNQSSCNAVFVGKMNTDKVTLTFEDCEIASDYKVQIAGGGSVKLTSNSYTDSKTGKPKTKTKPLTGNKAGGFVATAANAKAISFNNCRVGGDWTFKGNQSAPFVGYATAPCTFANCSFIGNLNASGGKSAAFIGNGNKAFTFDNCYFNGSLTSTGSQSGGFIGCIDNPGTAMFDSCEADAAIYAMQNRISFFVGQAYSSGKATLNGEENQTVYMKDCTATGTLISSSNWEGAFVSVVSGSWNKIGQEATVTFDGCTANVFMVASGSVAAYVGSNGNGTAHLNFKNCTNNATVYSVSSAGAWVAEFLDEYPLVKDGTPVESTISVDNDCTNNAKVYSVTLFEGDTTTAYTAITAEQIASGEYAYKIAQAQAAASVDAKYVYGQTIGTDAMPKVGGAAVYEHETLKVGKVYSNKAENYVYTIDCTEAPKAHVQYSDVYAIVDDETSLEYDAFNARVIIAVSEAKLAEIARVGITLTFKNGDEVVNTKTFGKGGIDSYYAVYAGDQIAQAAEGYVLVAVTVTGIPTAEWQIPDAKTNTCTISVTMEAFDANGALMPEYTLA